MIPWRFFLRLGGVYALTVVLMVLAINPYFSAGWDAQIFAGVGRAIIDNSSIFDMYQVSRQTWGDWGYPYPPLYAILLSAFIGLTYLIPQLPDWLVVRATPVLFDLALAVLVYLAIVHNSRSDRLGRLGAALWLFNPLTLYQTAIQAHQESAWLACVVGACALLSLRRRPFDQHSGLAGWLADNAALPSLLMALAVALKQSAVLFYIPYVMYLVLDRERRWPKLVVAAAIGVLLLGGLTLPFYLHSPDFFYLVVVDVANMPVQTQSAVVWLLGLSEFLIEQTRSSFFLLKYQAAITIVLTAVLSFLALRRRNDLFRLGLLVALLFFLTSKKVMGYHYPLLVPFLLIYALPRQRFDLIGIAIVAASWIIVSPYYAPWAKPEHFVLYAMIATPNTLLWLWLFAHVWLDGAALHLYRTNVTERLWDGGAATIAICLLSVGMILSSLMQPWSSSAPLMQVVSLLAVLAASLLLAAPIAGRLWPVKARLQVGHVVLALLLIPVYYAAFALTSESTRIIEGLLQ